MANIVIITGSPSKSSRLNGVINHVSEQLINGGFIVKQIDVCDLPAEDLLHANFNSVAIKGANKLIEKADGIIIATPVYKASYTGILKAFLDIIPEKGLVNKVMLPIAMGGTTAHLLMLEYALKPVLSVLGANHIEAGVFVHDRLVKWNEQGKVDIEEEVNTRLLASIREFCSAFSNKVHV
jgi:FMN reductase